MTFTAKRSLHLAFMSSFTKPHGRALARAGIQPCFMATRLSVQQVIPTFERKGLIPREPGVARSIRVHNSSGRRGFAMPPHVASLGHERQTHDMV